MPSKTSRLKPRTTTVIQSTPRQQPTTTYVFKPLLQFFIYSFSKKMTTKNQFSSNNSASPPLLIETKSLDENTRPFTINAHQHLYNTTRERDCDEYPYRSSRDEEMNEIYSATLRDLDTERDKRWRAEQEIKHLNDVINDLKRRGEFIQVNETIQFCFYYLGNDGRSTETILQELSDKHQQKLADEKSKFQDLTTIVDDYKVKIHPKSTN